MDYELNLLHDIVGLSNVLVKFCAYLRILCYSNHNSIGRPILKLAAELVLANTVTQRSLSGCHKTYQQTSVATLILMDLKVCHIQATETQKSLYRGYAEILCQENH